MDVRWIQLVGMGLLLSCGVYLYDFSLLPSQVVATFTIGLLTQLFWIHRLKLPMKSLLSAGISCFGIVLLMRSSSLWAHPFAALFAINSKFWFQKNRRHFFNPSAVAIVLAIAVFPNSWISPGQWGSSLLAAAWILAMGTMLVSHVKRIDITWLFLTFYLGGLFIRNTYLGYEIEIFYHTAMSGSLLLFAFFMISDPMTSPDHVLGKMLQALFVAAGSLTMHYYFFIPNGFVYMLVLSAFFVPFINSWLPAKRFQWSSYEVDHSAQLSFRPS